MGASNKGKSDKGGFKGKRSARGASVAGEKARSRQNRGQDVGTSGPPARDRFKSTEDVDISLLLGSGANTTRATHIINNIAK